MYTAMFAIYYAISTIIIAGLVNSEIKYFVNAAFQSYEKDKSEILSYAIVFGLAFSLIPIGGIVMAYNLAGKGRYGWSLNFNIDPVTDKLAQSHFKEADA